MTLGQRIQGLRKAAGLSQESLGEALKVSRQAVSKWERDGGIPEVDTLIAISRLFGVTVGALLGVEEPRREGKEKAEPDPAGGSNKDWAEDLLRRYHELNRPKKRPLWQAAAAVVLVIALLAAGQLSARSGQLPAANECVGSGGANAPTECGGPRSVHIKGLSASLLEYTRLDAGNGILRFVDPTFLGTPIEGYTIEGAATLEDHIINVDLLQQREDFRSAWSFRVDLCSQTVLNSHFRAYEGGLDPSELWNDGELLRLGETLAAIIRGAQDYLEQTI